MLPKCLVNKCSSQMSPDYSYLVFLGLVTESCQATKTLKLTWLGCSKLGSDNQHVGLVQNMNSDTAV